MSFRAHATTKEPRDTRNDSPWGCCVSTELYLKGRVPLTTNFAAGTGTPVDDTLYSTKMFSIVDRSEMYSELQVLLPAAAATAIINPCRYGFNKNSSYSLSRLRALHGARPRAVLVVGGECSLRFLQKY